MSRCIRTLSGVVAIWCNQETAYVDFYVSMPKKAFSFR